jgi:ribosome-binding protein aMBF1 (putative translation factor)
MGRNMQDMIAEWEKDPEFVHEYAALKEQQEEYVRVMIDARCQAGLTQKDLAKRMKTTQSAIARLESGAQKPSLNTVERYAFACKMRLHIALVPMKKPRAAKKSKAA